MENTESLFWDEGANRWEDAIPVGNGYLGAMVYGHTSRDRIQLNEDSLWNGQGFDRINPKALEHLPEIRKLVLARKFKDAEELLSWLKENKPSYEPVLSHGDFCLPNVFIKDGKLSGLIDLGNTGTGDKWMDIALGYRSLKHNFDGTYGGKVYEGFRPEVLFEKLGIEPDMEKIRYYILLDELF